MTKWVPFANVSQCWYLGTRKLGVPANKPKRVFPERTLLNVLRHGNWNQLTRGLSSGEAKDAKREADTGRRWAESWRKLSLTKTRRMSRFSFPVASVFEAQLSPGRCGSSCQYTSFAPWKLCTLRKRRHHSKP